MDLHIGITSINSSALEVACPAPGIGEKKKFRKFLRGASELLTYWAVLLWKVLSWISILALLAKIAPP
jgi:hypothetical protein